MIFILLFNNADILNDAQPYLPILDSLLNVFWTTNVHKEFIAGQIEQESCASAKLCWNSNAEFKTTREDGFGLSQITIAFNKDGSTRFNNFLAAKQKYKELRDWSWSNRFSVSYQLTYIILQMKSLYTKFALMFADDINTFAASFVSYNAGQGTLLSRRALCKITANCQSDKWFGALEGVHPKSAETLLYGVPLYERQNSYPKNIEYIRSLKYKTYFNK